MLTTTSHLESEQLTASTQLITFCDQTDRPTMHLFVDDQFKTLQQRRRPAYPTPTDINDLLVRMYMLGRHLQMQGHPMPGLGELADVGLYRNTDGEVSAPMEEVTAAATPAQHLLTGSSATMVDLTTQASMTTLPSASSFLPQASFMPQPLPMPAPELLCSQAELCEATYPGDDMDKMLRRQERMRAMDAWYTNRQWEALQALERDLTKHFDETIGALERKSTVKERHVAELTRKLVELHEEKAEVENRLAQFEARVMPLNGVNGQWATQKQALLNEMNSLRYAVGQATRQLNEHETAMEDLRAENTRLADFLKKAKEDRDLDASKHEAAMQEAGKQKQALQAEVASIKDSLQRTMQQNLDQRASTDTVRSQNAYLVSVSKNSHSRELEYRATITRLNDEKTELATRYENEKAQLSTKYRVHETQHEAYVKDLLAQITTLQDQNRRVDEAAKEVLTVCKTQQEQITKLDFELGVARAALSSQLTINRQRQRQHSTSTETETEFTPPTSRSTSGGSSVVYHEPPSARKGQSFTHIELRVDHWAAVPAKRKLSRVVSDGGEDVLSAVMRRLRERAKKVKQGEGRVLSREVSVCSEGSVMDWTVCG